MITDLPHAFDPAVRMLACERCGAPLEGGREQVSLRCTYCGASHELAVADVVRPSAPVDPAVRARHLLEQLERPPPPMPVADFLDAGALAPWRKDEALAAWAALRGQLRRGHDADAAERFTALTWLLADAAGADRRTERAWLESGYETAPLPRQRTRFAARIALRAAEAGALEAARAWLARGDAHTQDLAAFSVSSVATARLALAAGQPTAARDAIVIAQGRHLLAADDLPLGAMLRAAALEREGAVEAAAGELALAADVGPTVRAALHRIHEGERDLASRAYARFAEARGRARASITSNLVVLGVFTCLWGTLGAVSVLQLVDGESAGWFVGALVGLSAALLLLSSAIGLVRHRHGWRTPVAVRVVTAEEPRPNAMRTARLTSPAGGDDPITVRIEDHDHLPAGAEVLVFRSGQGLGDYVLLR